MCCRPETVKPENYCEMATFLKATENVCRFQVAGALKISKIIDHLRPPPAPPLRLRRPPGSLSRLPPRVSKDFTVIMVCNRPPTESAAQTSQTDAGIRHAFVKTAERAFTNFCLIFLLHDPRIG